MTETSLPALARPLASRGPKRSLRERLRANPAALASLVFSLAWLLGVGSVVGLVLGVTTVRRARGAQADSDATALANAGIVFGLVGLLVAVLFWTGYAGANDHANSSSYGDGRAFAAASYANATSESSLCDKSNAHSYDNLAQWMQGCHDVWYIAEHSLNNSGMPGLNVG